MYLLGSELALRALLFLGPLDTGEKNAITRKILALSLILSEVEGRGGLLVSAALILRLRSG